MDPSPAAWSQQPGETAAAWFNRLRTVDAKTLDNELAATHARMFQAAAIAVRTEAASQRWRTLVEGGSEIVPAEETAPTASVGDATVMSAAGLHAPAPALPALAAVKAAYQALGDEDRKAFILWVTRGMPE